MKIYFDVDDTLYDQYTPFKHAYSEVFSDIYLPIRTVFKQFRFHSDDIFELSQKGLISMQDMYIYRISYAFKDFGVTTNEEKALLFQKFYQKNLNKIKMSNTMINILDLIKQKGIQLGIITNGPSVHQRNKLKQLRAFQWFANENIYVSSEVGISKPDKDIFERIGKGKEFLYIGDSYNNDVIGAKKAEWKCIWLNKKSQKPLSVKPDYEVKNEEELLNLIAEIIK